MNQVISFFKKQFIRRKSAIHLEDEAPYSLNKSINGRTVGSVY